MQAEGGPEGRPGMGEALRSEGAWAGVGEAKTMGEIINTSERASRGAPSSRGVGDGGGA